MRTLLSILAAGLLAGGCASPGAASHDGHDAAADAARPMQCKMQAASSTAGAPPAQAAAAGSHDMKHCAHMQKMHAAPARP